MGLWVFRFIEYRVVEKVEGLVKVYVYLVER